MLILSGGTKMQYLEGIQWNKGYFKDHLTWKENLHLNLQNITSNFSFSAHVTPPHCKNSDRHSQEKYIDNTQTHSDPL